MFEFPGRTASDETWAGPANETTIKYVAPKQLLWLFIFEYLVLMPQYSYIIPSSDVATVSV